MSLGIGLASVLVGITVAYYGNLPPGGTTVLVAAGAAVLSGPLGALRGR
jgi:ABC-type Mn2+/Zn2+ transport system permease subunit